MKSNEAIELVEQLSGNIGSGDTEQIESSISLCSELKSYLCGVDEELETLNSDVENLNNRVISLQSANNKIMRQLHSQTEIAKNANEEISKAQEIANFY